MKALPVGILGGMGPEAGTEFTRLFIYACIRHLRENDLDVKDQSFPEHWLAQIPAVDRSEALLSGGLSPLPALMASLNKMENLGVGAVAIACNTAHYWHADLQFSHPRIKLLHIVDETVSHLRSLGIQRVGLLATTATIQIGLYSSAFSKAGIDCFTLSEPEQAQLMHGIYAGVKTGNLSLGKSIFSDVVAKFSTQRGVSTVVLACTEISVALSPEDVDTTVRLINPTDVLAHALARFAYDEQTVESR